MQWNLDPISSLVRLARLHDVARLAEQDPAARAGRLDRRLDDGAPQLFDVVRRAEDIAEAGDRIAQSCALGVELGQPRLQL